MSPKEIVMQWWVSGADFEAGTGLFSNFGKNKTLASVMPGRPNRYHEKLKYELCKAVGLDRDKMPAIHQKPLKQVVVTKVDLPVELPPPVQTIDDNNYPPLVRRVIAEYAEMYRKRGALHWEMASVPHNNEKEHCEKRAGLLMEIKVISKRMDTLHIARQAYLERKEIPDPAILWPKELPPPPPDPLPEDVQELKRLKKQLQTSLMKDRNLLDYQQKMKQKNKSPMPAGPRRLTIEKRMVEKLNRIELIEYKLIDLQ